MISQFAVIEGSPLIGLRLEDIVDKYHVKILHFHNSPLSYDIKVPYNPATLIKRYLIIKVEGKDKNIRKLMLDSINYS